MYIDMIHYRRAEGVSMEDLLETGQKVHRDWMEKQPGFLGWSINTMEDGSGIDFVHWENREAAAAATEAMKGMPHAEEWMGCYAPGSIKGQAVLQALAFPGGNG